jgi:hypothetical protein
MNWEVISKYERTMVLERGSERKELICPTNRVGTAIFGALSPLVARHFRIVRDSGAIPRGANVYPAESGVFMRKD